MAGYKDYSRVWATALLLGSAALLGACGSGSSGHDNGPANGNTTVRGTAAVGAPLAGASVVLHCRNSWNKDTTADGSGIWQIAVPAENLPCAVRATAAGAPPQQVFYSLAARGANTVTANVTPLTSLALARALGSAPDDAWFNALGNDGLQTALDALPAAVAALNTALAGYALPDSFNPFSSALDVTVANDAHDALLDQLKAALGNSSFDALLAAFAGNGTLPAPVDNSGNGGSDTITTPGLANTEFGVRFASNGTVMGTAEIGVVRFIEGAGSINVSGNHIEAYVLDGSTPGLNIDIRLPKTLGTGSHVCGDALSAGDDQKTIALGYAANNGYSSLGTKGVAGFECALNITHVGSISGSSYTGYVEGNFKARLFKTGGPVTLANSVLVAGTFRIGTGPVEGGAGNGGSTPTTPAGKLAAAFGAGFSGTYALSCSGAPHTVTINEDGSSLLDGNTLLGPVQQGLIQGKMEIASANTITGKYYVSIINNTNISRAFLNFTNNTLDSVDIGLPGQNQIGCTLTSAAPDSRFSRLDAIRQLAPFGSSLNCTASNQAARDELADGAQAFSLAADGSLTLGGVSASTTQASLSSMQVAFFGDWYEPAFYSGVTSAAGTGYRAVDVRFNGAGSTAQSVKFSINGSAYSTCLPQ